MAAAIVSGMIKLSITFDDCQWRAPPPFFERRIMARPDYVTDEHLEYLDDLRESGQTNMFGARPYLIREFPLDRKFAAMILIYWIKTFGEDDR